METTQGHSRRSVWETDNHSFRGDKSKGFYGSIQLIPKGPIKELRRSQIKEDLPLEVQGIEKYLPPYAPEIVSL